jgi:hypothetical protein
MALELPRRGGYTVERATALALGHHGVGLRPLEAPGLSRERCHCARYRSRLHGPYASETRWGFFCDAFPDGIPEAIIRSRGDHRQPVEGDHGLQFLPKSEAAAAKAERRIAEALHYRVLIVNRFPTVS